MIERVGLNETLIARSRPIATAIATPRMASSPSAVEIAPIEGRAVSMSAVSTPPTRMKGRRRPPHSQTLSLMMPISSWPTMPASGPAAHTMPISWMSSPYLVDSYQDRAEICTDSAKPIAVDGRLNSTRNGTESRCCMRSMESPPRARGAA